MKRLATALLTVLLFVPATTLAETSPAPNLDNQQEINDLGKEESKDQSDSQETDEIFPVIISEIYANPPAIDPITGEDRPSEQGYEFIELHNQTVINIPLAGFKLTRPDKDEVIEFKDEMLAPGEYLAVMTPFALPNGGGEIELHYPSEGKELILLQPYQAQNDDTTSWSLVDDKWLLLPPSPDQENPTPNTDEDEEETGNENEGEGDLCSVSGVDINEIVANPSGSDASGGEFIELKNNGDNPVDLTSCLLMTDKNDKVTLDSLEIPADGLLAIELYNDLLNGGGVVTFVTQNDEHIVEYPALGDDDSWSYFTEGWELSEVATPNATNQRTPVEKDTEEDEGLGPCPEGKFRNPETNRCKNIVDAASSLIPCDPDQRRNPETNRCRKIATLSSGGQLKPCDPDQERNPATNRCRKKTTTDSSGLKPCDEGEERNPETNRCRGVAAVLSDATIDPPANEAGIHTGVFVVMTALAVFYGVWEYRLDFANWYTAAKEKIARTA